MSAPRISINGRYLDEVQTRIEYARPRRGTSLLSLPAKYHRVALDRDGLTLRTPALTALQLHHDGVLGSGAVQIAVGDEDMGRWEIEWLRILDGHEFGEPVLLGFRRVGEPESAGD